MLTSNDVVSNSNSGSNTAEIPVGTSLSFGRDNAVTSSAGITGNLNTFIDATDAGKKQV